jgi:hypothetical protein
LDPNTSKLWIRKEQNMMEAGVESPEQAAEERAPRPQWELAECTCPDYCERDHELD